MASRAALAAALLVFLLPGAAYSQAPATTPSAAPAVPAAPPAPSPAAPDPAQVATDAARAHFKTGIKL
jgi:hypothetical protein